MVPVTQHLAEITSLTEELSRMREQVQHEASMRAAAEAACEVLQRDVGEQQMEQEEEDNQPAPRRSRRNRK